MKISPKDTERKFMEMYEGFNDEIFRFCLSKTRNRDLSLDITQETFVKTWDYMRSGKTIDMARAFLYRTARNLIIDHSRKKQSLSLDTIMEDGIAPRLADDKVEISGSRLDIAQAIEQLKQLPEQHYDILVLRFIQELTLAEIAAMYKESENTISVKIHRAIKYAQKLFPAETEALL
jgi:RNA polymerase sigma-70 factor (ECF subfamily)